MFNEINRFVSYKRHYLFDSVCDAIYSLIFIVGIIAISLKQGTLNMVYFYIYFLMTNSILSANEELEYEIRTNQYDNLITSHHPLTFIYLKRSLIYLCWSTMLFLVSLVLLSLNYGKIVSVEVRFSWLSFMLIFLTNMALFLFLYIGAISLTKKYKRSSVFLHFLNTIILFGSGLVFPVSFVTYSDLLDNILKIF